MGNKIVCVWGPTKSVHTNPGDNNNYLVQVDPRKLPGRIIPLHTREAFHQSFYFPGRSCFSFLSDEAKDLLEEACVQATGQGLLLVCFRGLVDPAEFGPYPGWGGLEGGHYHASLQQHRSAAWRQSLEGAWSTAEEHPACIVRKQHGWMFSDAEITANELAAAEGHGWEAAEAQHLEAAIMKDCPHHVHALRDT